MRGGNGMKVYRAPNALRKQAHRQIYFIVFLWLTALFVFSIMDTLDILKYAGFFLLGFVCLMTGYLSRMYTIAANGLRGERLAVKTVKKGMKDFVVFTNLVLEYEGKESETDLILVGKKGLFVVEVKNHIGRITGKEADKRWIQHKIGSKGGHYANPFYNPTKQVKTHVFRLSQLLKEHGYPHWIQGVVWFSHPKAVVEVSTKQIPVLTHKYDVVHYLTDYVPRKEMTEREVGAIVDILKECLLEETQKKKGWNS